MKERFKRCRVDSDKFKVEKNRATLKKKLLNYTITRGKQRIVGISFKVSEVIRSESIPILCLRLVFRLVELDHVALIRTEKIVAILTTVVKFIQNNSLDPICCFF